MEPNEVLTFVTGKGGTGKSFLSCLLAVRKAHQNQKVLLIDTENSSSLAEIFEHEKVGYEPVEVYKNVWISQVSTDEALTEYLNLYAKVPTWAKITPLARLIELVSHAAPGVKEILVCGKICFEAKKIIDSESEFDHIIVDAPSSGHVISLLDAPNALAEIVTRGGIQNQTQWMSDIISSKFASVAITTLAQEVVVSETKELINNIETKTSAKIGQIIINRDISHNLKSSAAIKKIDTNSQILNQTFKYYRDLVEQSIRFKSSFSNYEINSFPRILIESPNIRTLRKYKDELQEAKVNR